MARSARWTLFALGLGMATAVASAEPDEEGFRSLDSVEQATPRALDRVDTGHTDPLDAVDAGRSEDPDALDAAGTEPLNGADTGTTHALDGVPEGSPQTLGAAERDRGWQPPSCDAVSVDLGAVPPGSDTEAWSDRLSSAQRRLEESQQRLALANAAYARSLNLYEGMGEARAEIVERRDLARRDYASARCALPRLIDHARRAGVPAGVLRPYL